MLRTPTGQTGRDAYTFEAAAIANEQRELDARFTRLLEAAHAEKPELFGYSTDYHPKLTHGAQHAADFGSYIAERPPC